MNVTTGWVNQLWWNGHTAFERFLEAEARRDPSVSPSEEEEEEEDELATDPDLVCDFFLH